MGLTFAIRPIGQDLSQPDQDLFPRAYQLGRKAQAAGRGDEPRACGSYLLAGGESKKFAASAVVHQLCKGADVLGLAHAF
ncbi:MAG: hypothetical protein ACJ786_12740 [Catenulispora sp.]